MRLAHRFPFASPTRIPSPVRLSCLPYPLRTHRDILEDYAKKMRDAENEPHEGKRKTENVWCVPPAACLVPLSVPLLTFLAGACTIGMQAHHAHLSHALAVHL